MNELIKDTPDYAMTYGEIVAMLDAKGVAIEPVEESYQESSVFGKRFASSGGVAGAVMEVMKELGEDTSDIRLMTCAGGEECKKAMTLLKVGKLNVDFVEGMICNGKTSCCGTERICWARRMTGGFWKT